VKKLGTGPFGPIAACTGETVNHQTLESEEATEAKGPTRLTFPQKVVREIKVVGLITLYFAFCFGVMMLLKRLVLAQYQVDFRGMSLAIFGALVAAKVVAVLEKVPLGSWVRRRPAAVDVAARTLLYTFVVFIVLVLEKGFEARHEAGGFGEGILKVLNNRDMDRVWASTISVGGTLFAFNALSILRKRLGKRGLIRLFFATPLEEIEAVP
jgi:hypothetical protein